jgi:hypothetical protein
MNTGIRAPGSGETWTGIKLLVIDEWLLDPSCFDELSPQHQTELSSVMAQVCWSPAAMRLVKSVVEIVIVAATELLFETVSVRQAREKAIHNEP